MSYENVVKFVKERAKQDSSVGSSLRIDIRRKGSGLRRTFLWDGINIYRQGLFGKEGGILGKYKNMDDLVKWADLTYNKFEYPDLEEGTQGLTLNAEGKSRLR